MFYILLFSALAVLLVIAGITAVTRMHRYESEPEGHHTTGAAANKRKATRAQSRADRRKRH